MRAVSDVSSPTENTVRHNYSDFVRVSGSGDEVEASEDELAAAASLDPAEAARLSAVFKSGPASLAREARKR